MTPVAVITGASAGIGAELARVFARNGHALVLVARRRERLDALSAEIAAAGQPAPIVLPADLGQPDAAAYLGSQLEARGLEPRFVVNNAGFGLVGRAAALDRAEQLAMIDLNVRTLTDLSLAFVPSLVRNRGGLLNVASVAGFLPGPGSAVYYATKAYVLSLTEALHVELKSQKLRVTCLCPGPVATEFQARAGVPHARISGFLGVPAAQVAEAGYDGLMRGQRLVIPGFGNKLITTMLRFIPRQTRLAAVDARQRGRT
jgi:short-subunit dehydrogenase